jgi:rhodanese-related sulfurtransferase
MLYFELWMDLARGYTLGVTDPPIEMPPTELKARLDSGESVRLIDVREPEEYAVCRIEGAQLIPMRKVPENLNDLRNEEGLMVVYCHHGMRSRRVVDWLRAQGVRNCRNLSGGIDLWSVAADPAVARY